ncbi:MAG: VapC toxin family PIN domain ribonuclease [Prochlorococcaceae cyanobacterium]|jgi:predicted nucleic acid-binding protein
MRALLDINGTIALLDRGHLMHRAARVWMEQELEHGWATCPITQNSVVRIMAQPSHPNHRPAAQVAERLGEACSHASHLFWPEQISLLQAGLIRWKRVLGPRQITDSYLLACRGPWRALRQF